MLMSSELPQGLPKLDGLRLAPAFPGRQRAAQGETREREPDAASPTQQWPAARPTMRWPLPDGRASAVAGAERAQDIALASVGGGLSQALRAWRGRSGRRYVVSVYALEDDSSDYAGALLLAVHRDADGQRRLIEARESSDLALTGYNGRWVSAMRQRGANELHVHLLAASREARHATMVDLAGE